MDFACIGIQWHYSSKRSLGWVSLFGILGIVCKWKIIWKIILNLSTYCIIYKKYTLFTSKRNTSFSLLLTLTLEIYICCP